MKIHGEECKERNTSKQSKQHKTFQQDLQGRKLATRMSLSQSNLTANVLCSFPQVLSLRWLMQANKVSGLN